MVVFLFFLGGGGGGGYSCFCSRASFCLRFSLVLLLLLLVLTFGPFFLQLANRLPNIIQSTEVISTVGDNLNEELFIRFRDDNPCHLLVPFSSSSSSSFLFC